MSIMAEPNPFEVLHLDPSAEEEEIVCQAGRLRQRAADEAERNAIRQAVQALTASPEARQLYAVLTHPRPEWSNATLDRFTAAHRRAPASEVVPAPCPPLDLEEFTALLCELAAEELRFQPLELQGVPAPEEPQEIRRQTAEALWQSLLFDPRA
jgi:hypothetical protein